MGKLNLDKLFELAVPFLEKNDFGTSHTQRVFNLAKQNFKVKPELQELTFASIILHDIGGSSIKDQYEKGPIIAAKLLEKLGYADGFIRQVCEIISTHHEHPDNPSEPFLVLYDSDKLVMFSPDEFFHYDSRKDFDWNKILALFYSKHMRELAKKELVQRSKEKQ
jgi:hypothetical protein